jgi:hypothetical protein
VSKDSSRRKVIFACPYFDSPTRCVVQEAWTEKRVEVQVLPFQPVIWGTLSQPEARWGSQKQRFPLVIDTGLNAATVTIGPRQLAEWAGVPLDLLTVVEKDQLRNGAKITRALAKLWIHHNEPQQRDNLTTEVTAVELDFLAGYENDEQALSLPCVGLGALMLNNLELLMPPRVVRKVPLSDDHTNVMEERQFFLHQIGGPRPGAKRKTSKKRT